MKHLSQEHLDILTQKLHDEQKKLEGELATVGRKNPQDPSDWEATAEDMDTMHADRNEAADALEEFKENTAILHELEIRLNHVKKAFEKIKDGTYGVCEISGDEIPLERLMANPAARTTVEHAHKIT